MFREVVPSSFFVSYNTLFTETDQEMTLHLCDEATMEHVMTLCIMVVGEDIVVLMQNLKLMEHSSLSLSRWNRQDWREQVEVSWIMIRGEI